MKTKLQMIKYLEILRQNCLNGNSMKWKEGIRNLDEFK
jgi:hypothetical protein